MPHCGAKSSWYNNPWICSDREVLYQLSLHLFTATCKQCYTLFMISTIFQCNINLIISVAKITVYHFQYCPVLCTLEYSYKHTYNMVKGYILMIPLSLPMATSDCSTSYANAVGWWGNPWLNTCEDNEAIQDYPAFLTQFF